MKLFNVALAATLVLAPAAIFAQAPQTTAPTTTTAAPVTGKTIQERKTDQQDRIAQGVKSGQLTAGETSHLEEMEARIKYDLDYLRNWSPMLDLKILFATAVKIFVDTRAY